MKRSLLAISLLGAFCVLSAGHISAATEGFDNTSNSAYNDGWQAGDNGGTGFDAWVFTTNTGVSGFFLQDSTTLSGTAGGNVNQPNAALGGPRAFGLYGGSSTQAGSARASRNFANAGSLNVGQSFSLDLAVNFRNGGKGVDLRDATGTTLFNFNVGFNSDPNVNSDDYSTFTPQAGRQSIGNTYSSNTAFHLTFTQTSTTGGTWEIIRSGGVSDNDTGTYSGVLSSFSLYVDNTQGGDPNNLFANNFTVVPEPATWLAGFLTLGAVGVSFAKRRRTLV